MITEHEKESIAAAYKEEGFLEGMEKGRAESAKAIARNLLERGMDIAEVATVTGLSADEVKNLK